MRPLKVHEKLAVIGSLQLVSHVVHKHHAGTRQTNKQTAHIIFVALFPVGFSRLSIAFF